MVKGQSVAYHEEPIYTTTPQRPTSFPTHNLGVRKFTSALLSGSPLPFFSHHRAHTSKTSSVSGSLSGSNLRNITKGFLAHADCTQALFTSPRPSCAVVWSRRISGWGVWSPGNPTLVPLILLSILTPKDIKDKNMLSDRIYTINRIFYSHRDSFLRARNFTSIFFSPWSPREQSMIGVAICIRIGIERLVIILSTGMVTLVGNCQGVAPLPEASPGYHNYRFVGQLLKPHFSILFEGDVLCNEHEHGLRWDFSWFPLSRLGKRKVIALMRILLNHAYLWWKRIPG